MSLHASPASDTFAHACRSLPTSSFPARVRYANPDLHGGRKEVVLIDTGLDEVQVLIDGAPEGVEVVTFGGDRDGLADLLSWSSTAEGYRAIHLLCHGASGRLMLGTRTLNREALADTDIQDALCALGLSLGDGGSLLLYSCNVAELDEGTRFVDELSMAAGAAIAASPNLVGASLLHGTWSLGYRTEAISVPTLAWPSYQSTLAILQNTTTFSDIPSTTNYANLPSNYASPSVLSVSNIASSGWDVSAQANNNASNTKTFLVRGIKGSNNGDGDNTSIRFEGYDMDYITFKSTEGFFFDLTSFSFRNPATSNFTVQALNSSGATTGVAVAFTTPPGAAGSTDPFSVISLAGNTDFLGIYGFRVTLTSGSDTPNFDNLVVANIGLPADTTPPLKPAAPDLRAIDDSNVNNDNITNVTTPSFTGTAEADSTVTLYDTGGVIALGTAVATGGTWTITSSTLAEGSHTLTVKAVDAANNVSIASDSLVVVIDTTAPTAVALSSHTATTSTATANAAVATLSSSDPTAVTYALVTGSGGNDSGNSLFTLSGTTLSVGNTPLAAGTYNIYLSATDTAGNVSNLAQTFTVNNVPTVSSIVRAGGASDTVASNASSVSYTVTFSESVTGVDANDFALTFSGSASAAISGISGSGTTYTVTVNTLAGDGAMRLDLKGSGTSIQNGANVAVGGGYTAGATYLLDHTAPAAPLGLDMRAADDTGSDTDNITSVNTPILTGTAEAGSIVTLYDTDDSTVLGSAVATGGDWSITNSMLAEGSHTLRTRAVDAAGNVSAASADLVVVVDRSAPTAVALSNSTVATANASSGATVATLSATDSNAITYALVSGDGTSDADNISFVISGNTLSVGSSQLTPGSYHIYLSATDAAGNVSHLPQTINVVNAPSVSSIVRAGLASPTVAHNATSADFTVTFSESVSGVDTSDFALTSTNTASGTISSVTGSGTTYTVTVSGLSGDGQLRLDLNPSGTGIVNGSAIGILSGYSSGASYVLDHTAPAAPAAPDLRTLDDKGSSDTDNVTNVTTPELTGVAENGSTVTLYDTDGVLVETTVATGGSWTIKPTLTEGSHSLSVTATDAAGNESAASSALTVIIDTTAPTGLALSQTTVASGTTGPGATVATLSGSDINGPLVYALDNGNGTNDSGNGNFDMVGNTLTVRGSGLLTGSYNVYLSATDAAGNVSHLAQTINVVDAPSVSSIVRSGSASANIAASATSATFTVFFSESVNGVDTSDFLLTTTNTASGTISNVTGSGTTYTVTVSGLTGDGQLRLDLNPSGTGIVNGSAIAILSGYSSGASYVLDHIAPLAPSSASMTSATDTGSSPSDGITSNNAPSFTGTAEANATVRLYDTDGTTVLATVAANNLGNWSMSSVALSEASHTLTVRQTDPAGNESVASNPLTVVIDTAAAAPAAPTLAPSTDSGILGDRITNNNSPTINGTAEAFAAITLYAMDGVTVLGSGAADGDGVWSIAPSSPLADGTHTLKVSQTDRAGNVSTLSAGLVLTVDTAPPVAPGAPVLAVASDSGTVGDGITTISQPVFTGTALPDAIVRLYDTNGTSVLGTAVADGSGNWSITSSTLSVGAHTLSARQLDAAGNVSPAGVPLNLTIEAPPAPPAPPSSPAPSPIMVDGVPVTQLTVLLPGGGTGTQTVIGIITNDRNETTGNAGVADIALSSDGATTLLMAQLAPGYGLTASGGTSQPASTTNEQLTQAILAATPDHTIGDKTHLTGEGVKFLNQLIAGVPLLVNTITPISTPIAPAGSLTLTGTSTDSQHTALVIDTSGLAAGSSLTLNSVDFAAIIGAANVTGNTNRQILTGDVAGQGFTITDGESSAVFSGGGNDRVTVNSTPAASTQSLAAQTASTVTPLAATLATTQAVSTNIVHGGQGDDTVAFSGASTDYDVSLHRGYAIISSKAQPGQQSIVINAEDLSFADTTLKIENAASLTSLAGLYQNVLGRQADHLGIEFWADAHADGVSYGEIALRIIASVESQDRQAVAFNGDSAHDVELLYQTIFGRSSDAVGLNFWIDAMSRGMSFTDVASQFIEAPEMEIHKIGAQDWDFQLS